MYVNVASVGVNVKADFHNNVIYFFLEESVFIED